MLRDTGNGDGMNLEEITGDLKNAREVLGAVETSHPGGSSGDALRDRQDPLSEKIRELEEAKRILEDVEIKALSGVALALTEAAESLSATAKDLAEMRSTEWMTAEQASTYLGCESVKAFEKIAAREGIPRHYL